MHFYIVILQVDSASMYGHVDVKGIVSISEQADVSTVLARVEEEILQLHRRLNVLEELLVSTRLTAERDLQHSHVHLPAQVDDLVLRRF